MSDDNSHSLSNVYEGIEQGYLNIWCRFHPQAVLGAGIELYAGKLPPFDDESIGIQIVLNEKCLTALDELDQSQLSSAQILHSRILYGLALIEHHQLMDHDWRFRDPSQFVAVDAIQQLLIRPPHSFNEALHQRLLAFTELLRAGKHYLNRMPELIPSPWLDTAKQQSSTGIDFMRTLNQQPKASEAIADNAAITIAINEATKALESFAHTLDRLGSHCRGDFACGREQFDRLLLHRHFLPINSHTLRDFGERLFKQTKQQLDDELAASGLSLDQIQQSHPDAADLLATYQQEIHAAHTFLADHDLVPLPETEQLNVIETPAFLRHKFPFSTYLEPTITDHSQTGFYYLTPPSNVDELKQHNYAAIAQNSIHQLWPGYHLQRLTANQSTDGSQLLRRLTPCTSLSKGWALYSEQMMLEQGYVRHSGQKIVMLSNRLRRALQIVIDVDIHTNGLSLEQAAQMLCAELGVSHQQAMADLRYYSHSPAVAMNGAVGWALINTLKQIILADSNKALPELHQRLLTAGNIALPLVIQHHYGDNIWQQCCQHVFGEIQ